MEFNFIDFLREIIGGSASFARGNVEALVGIWEALAAVEGDVGLKVLSTGQSATSPTVKEEPLRHSAYSIYCSREQMVLDAGVC